ncbi:hypothetical protein GCM10010384_09420 [Streptomyces djakartensis]|uniref:Uncharacterized protein n=1 Tax=Streptomyces djakartensis TaxID=68193 RepID=A0ABQ2ZBH1_9ACTN|nr:hypothetical protein GCM10010384_09420 [Streptomyces djakartensis]
MILLSEEEAAAERVAELTGYVREELLDTGAAQAAAVASAERSGRRAATSRTPRNATPGGRRAAHGSCSAHR